MKDITLGDIARVAKCSKNTVSLALRGSNRISEARRQSIEAIALSLGYVPNLSARHLSARKSGYIGIYTNSLLDSVRSTLVHDLITGFGGTGYHPILGLGDAPKQEWHEASWIQAFRAMRAEAIVLVAEFTRIDINATAPSVPTILVHCQPGPGLQCDYVGLDRAEASLIGRNHLFSRGCRSIIVYGSTGSTFTKTSKSPLGLLPEYQDSCHTDVFAISDTELDDALDIFLGHYMENRTAYDGALFQDSALAASFIDKVVSRGISVPEDLAVVGYDYLPRAELLKVALTTVEQPLHDLASVAIDIIQNRVSNPKAPWTHEVLSHNLVIREST